MTELRDGLARLNLTKMDKYLLIVALHDGPITNAQIKAIAKENGWKAGATSDPGSFLSKSNNAVRLPSGWIVTGPGRMDLEKRNVVLATGILTPVIRSLESLLLDVHNAETKRFVEEAVGCVRNKSFRAAIVLSWVGAVFVLYSYVVRHRLDDFNAEAHRRWPNRFKKAKETDDLTIMKEVDFLAVIEGIEIITKAEGKELNGCLERRNTAGHPNTHSFTETAVGSHVETLVSTVFKRF